MLRIQVIRWKNFLSFGNTMVEHVFDSDTTTLCVGSNGSGKSILNDALSFALFNRPYRDINKPQLVNSINRGECLVEIEFVTKGASYLIRRGMKPGIFEIWKNGEMISIDAKNFDYQKHLESVILGFNYKTFCQVIVLSTTSFTPFMKLSASNRREVVEDILDISVLSKMRVVVKDRTSYKNKAIDKLTNRLEVLNEKLTIEKRAMDQRLGEKGSEIRNLEKLISDHRRNENEIASRIEEMEKEIREKDEVLQDEIRKNVDELTGERNLVITIREAMKSLVSKAKILDENDTCPTCEREIDEAHRKSAKRSHSVTAKELNGKLSRIRASLSSLEEIRDSLEVRRKELNDLYGSLQDARSVRRVTTEERVRQESVLVKLRESLSTSNVALETEIGITESEIADVTSRIEETRNELRYDRAAMEMLRDDGIRASVVKIYLPTINRLINHYLTAFDFYVSFNLDETFNETIRSRHRDKFTYGSFSEGEKQRIDISLLLTWREIARARNSINTNVLILDETFDSSMDAEGTSILASILPEVMAGSNITVISHNSLLEDATFDRKLRYFKRGNFSNFEEV